MARLYEHSKIAFYKNHPLKEPLNGFTCIHFAITEGHLNVVEYLADKILEVKDENGRSPLGHACYWGNIEAVKCLIDKGANMVTGQNGETALMEAVYVGRWAIIKLLVEKYKVDVNVKDINGQTAYDVAVKEDYDSIMEYLLSHGAKTE